jgi:hypothetical protein
MPDAEATSEAGELALTLNQMLERLQVERRESTCPRSRFSPRI